MITQQKKGEQFRALHQQPGCFVIPNPWDAGSAKILASTGFKALATTSAGLASCLGRCDGRGLISPEETFANIKEIVEATELPVSADLENGFYHQPQALTETIYTAGQTGLVGASIEDASGDPDNPIYAFELAVERIQAAAEAVKSLPYPFMLTARAENFCHGRPDLKDTIHRLQAFQEAGVDVLYAPGLNNLQDIATLVREVDLPVNVVMGLSGADFSVQDLSDVGVKRISLGSSMHRAALGALLNAAHEIVNEGSFSFSRNAMTFDQLDSIFESPDDVSC